MAWFYCFFRGVAMWRERWLPFFRYHSPTRYTLVFFPLGPTDFPKRFSPSVICFVLMHLDISSSSSCLIFHCTSFISIWQQHDPHHTVRFLSSALDENCQTHSSWQISVGNKHGINISPQIAWKVEGRGKAVSCTFESSLALARRGEDVVEPQEDYSSCLEQEMWLQSSRKEGLWRGREEGQH